MGRLAAAIVAAGLFMAVACDDAQPQATATPSSASPTLTASPSPARTQAPTVTPAVTPAPVPHYPLSRRTGNGVVDAVLAAVASGETDALAALAGGHVLPCTDDRGSALPVCPPGHTTGTAVHSFYSSQCHAGWVAVDTDARAGWERFLAVSQGLYAVLQLTPRTPEGPEARPGADYVLVFTGVTQRPGLGSMLAIRDGRIIAVDNGCTPTAAELAANPSFGTVTATLLPPP